MLEPTQAPLSGQAATLNGSVPEGWCAEHGSQRSLVLGLLVTSCFSPESKGRRHGSKKALGFESGGSGSNSGSAGSGQVPNSFELSFPILVVVRIESDHVCQVSDIKEMPSKCWLVNK